MQKYTYLLAALLLAGCAENKAPKQPEEQDSTQQVEKEKEETPSPEKPVSRPLPEKVLGERADGSITLLDTVDGKEIAVLNDNALLLTGVPVNGWAAVMVETEINAAQEKSEELEKGQALLKDKKTVGRMLADVTIENSYTLHDGGKIAVLYGYIPVSKIKNGSVIETALSQYLAAHPGRMLPDIQPFIRQFQLEPTHMNGPYQEYMNYESGVEDPSPGYRIVLVFYKNKLTGVVSSRGLQLKGARHYALDREYHGYFYNDADAGTRQAYIKMFNEFINAAD